MNTLRGRRLVLASTSPRRRELLAMLDVPFEVRSVDCDESYPADLLPEAVPVYLARVKSEAAALKASENEIVITADTVVVLDGQVLGKPNSVDDACYMLKRLSGRTHRVITGVAVASQIASSVTEVDFGSLSESDIRYYVDKYHPLDKAGAYGIQEWIGAVGIRSIRGSFYNVMGLPIHLIRTMLREIQ